MKNLLENLIPSVFKQQEPALEGSPFSFSMGGGQKPNKPTVRVERRRPGSTGTPSSRPRADTPSRDVPQAPRPQSGGSSGGFSSGGSSSSGGSFGSSGSSGGGSYSSGGGGGGAGLIGSLLSMLLSGGAGSTRGGKRRPSLILIIILIALAACCILFVIPQLGSFLGDMGSLPETNTNTDNQNPVVEQPTQGSVVSLPTLAPASASKDTWLVMLYEDADDQVLEKDIFVDLNEAERVGSTDQVKIVAQIDRFRGAFSGDGNWTSAKRFYITRDNDLTQIGSQQVTDLGEVNMADSQTLIDFVTWAVQTYPADKYVLILSDHGSGWPGGWSDPTATGGTVSNLPISRVMGDQLYLMEIDQALATIRSQTGIDKFELLGMDACLMGHLEVASAMAPHARYFVGSQETEPSLGWAYAGLLQDLNANPGMSGGELGAAIVSTYIDEDQRIVDDAARADFARGGSAMGGMFGAPTAADIANQLKKDITLATIDLSKVPALMDSVNNLSYVMQGSDQRAIAQARSYAQSFTSIFGSNVPASYIDLGNFVQLLAKSSNDSNVDNAAAQVYNAIKQAVVAERHGSGKPGANGISIYFPNSNLYNSSEAGARSYTVAAERFATSSTWDEFLLYHYTGRQFDAAAVSAAVPADTATVQSPAAGGIEISNLVLSSTTAAPGSPILLSVDLEGANLGYVKLFVGYYDANANSIYVADSDYLESPDTRQESGVYYPVWESGQFTMEFEWEPIVYAISDGTNRAEAVFNPVTYGATPEEAVYSVDGIYTFADSGEQRYARLYFRNTALIAVYSLSSNDPVSGSTPREISVTPGDAFTVLEKWLDLDSNGSVKETVQEPGKTLLFGDQTFTWEALNAAPGQYIVGFIIEDLDGNQTPVYQQVTVE